MLGRKSRARSVPMRIKGRRRPRGELKRSLSAPARGWISMASIKPEKVRRPR